MSRPAAHFKGVLVVSDTRLDVDRIVATLRAVLGYTLSIRTARAANAAVDEVLREPPHLIIMDDVLAPDDTALSVMPLLRRAGYSEPIIIASRVTYAARTRMLLEAGAAHVMNKDDLDSVAIRDILVRLGLLEEEEGDSL